MSSFCHQTLGKLAPTEASVLSASSSPFPLCPGALAILNQGYESLFHCCCCSAVPTVCGFKTSSIDISYLHTSVGHLSCLHSGGYRTGHTAGQQGSFSCISPGVPIALWQQSWGLFSAPTPELTAQG